MSTRTAIVTKHGVWSASTRSRALQYVSRLERQLGPVDLYLADDQPERRPGRIGQIRYFADHGVRYFRRMRELSTVLPRYDAVLVQRAGYAVGPGPLVAPFDSFPGRVVFDLDDDVFALTPSMEGKGRAATWLYGPQQAKRLVDRADAIVVSTSILADSLPSHRAPVTVLATVPDVDHYEQAKDGGTPGLIGWAGTSGNLRHLDPLTEVLDSLATDGVGHLRVISSEPWHGPAEFVPWRLEDEDTMFAPFAVGIMPLAASEYAQAKAGYKLLQYMAAGVPVVASPIGVNVTLVQESEAGLLADSPAEWETALRRLLADPALRADMGRRGRAFVERYADLDGHAATLAALLRGS